MQHLLQIYYSLKLVYRKTLKKHLTNDIIVLVNINHTLNTLQEEKTMREKTVKSYTTTKGNEIEI